MWPTKHQHSLAIASVIDDVTALKAKISELSSIAVAAREQTQAGESITIAAKALAVQTGELEKRITDVEFSLTRLDDFQKEIKLAVAEGIERVDRADRRIKDTVRRARKEFRELGYVDPGLEAEVAGIRLVDDRPDGGGGSGEGMPPMRTDVAPAEPTPSSIPGVTAAELQRVRGI